MGIHSSRLIQLLSLLRPSELRKLQDFLHSPYHNTDPKLRILLGVVTTGIAGENPSPLNYEILSAAMFPGEPVKSQAVKDQMSRLTMKICQFLHCEGTLGNTGSQDLAVMAFLAERGNARLFGQYQASFLKKTMDPHTAGTSDLQLRIEAARITDQFQAREKSRQFAEGLQEKADLRNLNFLIHKLQEYCDMLNRNNIYGQHYDPSLMKEILAIIDHHPEFLRQSTLAVWYHALQTLLNPDGEMTFQLLLRTLESHGARLPEEDHRAAYKYALNFCIRQINAGKDSYLRLSFDVYQNMLNAGLMHVSGMLSHTDVKNIATAGIRLGEYEWVKDFLEGARGQVHKAFAENVYVYCLAYLYAESGQQGQAMRMLQEVQFTDAYYALSARNLLLRIFLEREEYEALTYQINAYEVFLRRNTAISSRNCQLHLNFARHLRKVVRFKETAPFLKEAERERRQTRLLEQLHSQEEIPNREWLIRQIA